LELVPTYTVRSVSAFTTTLSETGTPAYSNTDLSDVAWSTVAEDEVANSYDADIYRHSADALK